MVLLLNIATDRELDIVVEKIWLTIDRFDRFY